MSTEAVTYAISRPVQDADLEQLHAAAFGGEPSPTPWAANLQRYGLFWVTAHHDAHLVGFVNVLGDGGADAILMDTCVSPNLQGLGIGVELVSKPSARPGVAAIAGSTPTTEPT